LDFKKKENAMNGSRRNRERSMAMALAAAAGVVLCVGAVDFPSATGDIASAADWAVPCRRRLIQYASL
jgi:hypothetical protein